jgi:rubrerythrin
MDTHDQQTSPIDEEEIKLAILDDDPDVRKDVLERLWITFNEKLMRSLAHYHFGLSPEDHADIAYDAIVMYCDLFPRRMTWENKPIYPMMARIAINLGKDEYKKYAKKCEREDDVLSSEIADTLKDTDCGAAWHAAQASTRAEVGQLIRQAAATMQFRQRQIAIAFAMTWEKDHSEAEAIDFIYSKTGEFLTHDQFKRAWAEVRKKLKAPIDHLLKEEGYARQ